MATFTSDNFILTDAEIKIRAEGMLRNFGNEAARNCEIEVQRWNKVSPKGAETWGRIPEAVRFIELR